MADSADYLFAEVGVKASVRSAQSATPEEVVALGRKIWQEVCSSGVAPADGAGNAALLARLQDAHKDFTASFPLVLRWMVETRQFSQAAFLKYLRRHAVVKLDTRESFLSLQAEYLVLLFKEKRPPPSRAAVLQYRQQVLSHLLEEDRAFNEARAQAEKEIAARSAEVSASRQQALYALVLKTKLEREAHS